MGHLADAPNSLDWYGEWYTQREVQGYEYNDGELPPVLCFVCVSRRSDASGSDASGSFGYS